jgi:hypothetical protein
MGGTQVEGDQGDPQDLNIFFVCNISDYQCPCMYAEKVCHVNWRVGLVPLGYIGSFDFETITMQSAIRSAHLSYKTSICGLPAELLVMIFCELDVQTLLRCKAVSISICASMISDILTLNIIQGLSAI